MTRVGWVGFACVLALAFWAARLGRGQKRDGAAAVPTAAPVAGRGDRAGGGAAGRALTTAIDGDGWGRLTYALAHVPQPTQVEKETRATVQEPADARVLRHERLKKLLAELTPLMSSTTRDHILEVTDRLDGQNRQLRVDFMVGLVSEEDYFAGLRRNQREVFASLSRSMPGEQFRAVFRWDPDHDPFDPEGALPAPEETFTVGEGATK
jgi:hypothetical protein